MPNSRATSRIDARKALESLEPARLGGDDDNFAAQAGRGRGALGWGRGKTKLVFISLKLGAEKGGHASFQASAKSHSKERNQKRKS
jgi:hypothetical protein